MPTANPDSRQRSNRLVAAALSLLAAAACVNVGYLTPGERIEPRAGQSLVFGRIRFVENGREYFPWNISLSSELSSELLPQREAHFWLLQLDRRAVSAELHPDEDGSLAIRLSPGDYALVGSDEGIESGGSYREVVALLRVPGQGAFVYSGDLVFTTQYREGWSLQHGHFGTASVTREPLQQATAMLEARYGALPGALAASPWCVGRDVPAFTDADLAERARQLLDRGCPYSP